MISWTFRKFSHSMYFFNGKLCSLHRRISLGDSIGMGLLAGGLSPLMGTMEASAKNRTTFISEDAPRTIRVNFFQYFQGSFEMLKYIIILLKIHSYRFQDQKNKQYIKSK